MGKLEFRRDGERYEIESVFGDYKEKIRISRNAFTELTKGCERVIERETYTLTDNTKVKIYKGKYEGLCVADIEFKSQEEYDSFQKTNWLGCEITNTILGKDGKIILLSSEELHSTIINLERTNTEPLERE